MSLSLGACVMYVCVCVRTYICVCVRTYICVCVRMYICVCVCTCGTMCAQTVAAAHCSPIRCIVLFAIKWRLSLLAGSQDNSHYGRQLWT